MKVIGIIAEYNPFHNGHAYQINKIKNELQADYVVVAMSGDFVQRGAPAIVDKYTRAKMALSSGADLVIELPVLWATASAEYFAMAGVTLFDKMGCIDGICFGAETNNLTMLSMIADTLIEEPEIYRTALSAYLKNGMAFPAARSNALCDYFKNATFSDFNENSYKDNQIDLDIIFSILSEPNNILAIEYLKALKRRNTSIKPYVIKREGAGYHDTEIVISSAISADNNLINSFCSIPTASATAIRKVLDKQNSFAEADTYDSLANAIPAPALQILEEYMIKNALIDINDFSSILGFKLLSSDTTILSEIGDSTPDIANRFFKNRMNFSSFEQFCELNKTKDITYTRISRILLHLLLNIKACNYTFEKELDYIPYLRILGFRKDASPLLRELKHNSTVPVISKLANAASILNSNALELLKKDIFAADLYSQICATKSGTVSVSEYAKNIIRL